MTTPGADIRAVVLARVAPVWVSSLGSQEEVSRDDARRLVLTTMAEAQRMIAELTAYQDDLARQAATAGATHEERGAAVGLGKEAARRRWPWPTAKDAAPIEPVSAGLARGGAPERIEA